MRADQVRVKAKDRMIVVKMDATQAASLSLRSMPSDGEASHDLTLGHFLVIGRHAVCVVVVGIFLNRKNLIVLMMAIELMLLAVSMNFVAFSHYLGDLHGQVFVFFILTVAAC
jgi:NADH:ubiquinone oxidoreductase subunit K